MNPRSSPASQRSSPSDHSRPNKRRRNRKWLSCAPCHRSKQKCDRGLPCSRCVAQNRVHQCTYGTHSNGTMANGVSETPNDVLQLKDYNPVKGRARISGATQPMHLYYQFEELRPFLSHGKDVADLHVREKQLKCLYFHPKPRIFPFGDRYHHVHYEKASRSSNLPTQPTIRLLIERYLLTIDKLFPLLDPISVKQELEEFFRNPSSVSDAWLAQLYLVLALSCYTYPTSSIEGTDDNLTRITNRCLDAAETCFSTRSFAKRANLTDIRVLCMIAIAKILEMIPESDDAWTFVGLIARVAMSMQLHRDPAGIHNMPPQVAEERKRIWTTVQMLDIITSIDSGHQIYCLPENSDVPAPTGDLTASDDSTVDTICGIVNKVNGPNPRMNYNQVLKYDEMLRRALNQTQSSSGLIPHSRTDVSQPDWVYLQKTTVNTLLRRVLLALHQSHAVDAQESSVYQKSHWTVLECSLAILRHQQELSENSELAWAAELFRSDFRTAITHVILGLRSKHFAEKPSAGSTVSAKDLAWQALRSGLEAMRCSAYRSVDHFKGFIGTAVAVGVLEALERGSSIPDAIRASADRAFDEAEERLRQHLPQVDPSLSGPPTDTDLDSTDSVSAGTAGFPPYPWETNLDTMLYDTSLYPNPFAIEPFY